MAAAAAAEGAAGLPGVRRHCVAQTQFQACEGEEEPVYVYDLASTALAADVVAASGSNHLIQVYSLNTLKPACRLEGHAGTIVNIRFAAGSPAQLLSAGADGRVALWDLRTAKAERVYQVPPGLVPTSFDANCNDSLLCIGTELCGDDSHVLLWDVRHPEPVLAFSEAHSDDVTQVRFSPSVPTLLSSGSTDGLVNVFDAAQAGEVEDPEDCLIHTLNSESSVSRVGFFGPEGRYLYGLTHTETFLMWHTVARDCEEPEQIVHFPNLREEMASEGHHLDYLIDCAYQPASQRLFVFGGTFGGGLDMFHVNRGGAPLTASMPGGHRAVVRCVDWCPQRSTLISGGEDSLICIWDDRPAAADANAAQGDAMAE